MQLSDLKIDLSTLRQPILDETDEHLNYDDGLNINYNNIPLFYDRERFSGTIFENGGDYASLTEYEYGMMEGKHFQFDDSGKIVLQGMYEDGWLVEGRSWHANGNLEQAWDKNGEKSWYEDGSLAYEGKNRAFYYGRAQACRDRKYYFRNGNLRMTSVKTDNKIEITHFFQDGTAFFTFTWLQKNATKYYTFQHENILNHYQDWLNSPSEADMESLEEVISYPKIDNLYGSKAERLQVLGLWLENLHKIHPEKTQEITQELLTFSDGEIAEILLQKYSGKL
jgi:antitoxin component YwqK of YwqJK toxin-antitoxin module